MAKIHKPVLLKEVVEYLNIKRDEKYIDATVGGGGHSKAILKLGGKLLAIDCDPEAIKAARKCLSTACPSRRFVGTNTSWRLAQGNFKDLGEIARRYNFVNAAGILFDLGISTYQLKMPERGFSFSLEAPLDMRIDSGLKLTAADLINVLNKKELGKLFAQLAQERYSQRLAKAICQARQLKPIQTTRQLAAIINQALPSRTKSKRLHPATRCFLALRIAVNDELNNLRRALPQALSLLRPAGRLVVISFHSGEDRIVKQFFRESEKKGEIKIITKKPIRPSPEEIKSNPPARSAKLRVGEK